MQLQAKIAATQVSSNKSLARSKLSSSISLATSSAVRSVMEESKASIGPSNNSSIDDDDAVVDTMKAIVAMTEDIFLPPTVEQLLLDQIGSLVSTTIKLHAVGAVLDEESVGLMSELIMRDVASTARLAFASNIQHRVGLHEVFGPSSAVFQVFEGIRSEHLSSIDWFSDAIELTMNSAVGKGGWE